MRSAHGGAQRIHNNEPPPAAKKIWARLHRKKVLIGISVERETPASVVGGPHPTGPASGATKQILPPHTVQDWFNEKTCNTMTLIMAEVKRRLNATHLRRRLAEWRVVEAEVSRRRRKSVGEKWLDVESALTAHLPGIIASNVCDGLLESGPLKNPTKTKG